jgi:hypothetical protein
MYSGLYPNSKATYKRQFDAWEFHKRQTNFVSNPVLLEEIRALWHRNVTPKEMLYILQKKPEYSALTLRILQNIRLQHGFSYRNRNRAAHEAAWEVAQEVVQQHLKSGQSARYGITYTHSIVRMTARRFVSRAQVAAATRKLDPNGVAARKAKAHRRRPRYRIKGPNRVWSVDGHDKLKRFGFEIYRMVDAYSRFILDAYVGVGTW